MGLFAISRELSFRICNYGKPGASSLKAREAEWLLGRKKGSWGGEKKGSWGRGGRGVNRESRAFHWLSLLPSCSRCESSQVWSLGTIKLKFLCISIIFKTKNVYLYDLGAAVPLRCNHQRRWLTCLSVSWKVRNQIPIRTLNTASFNQSAQPPVSGLPLYVSTGSMF